LACIYRETALPAFAPALICGHQRHLRIIFIPAPRSLLPAQGGITSPETVTLIGLADTFRKTLEVVELESRVSVLEQNYKSRNV
jgi:hypothetical protein